jgi:hypothetical protein
VAQQHLLDGRAGEILAVDPQPGRRAAGEVDPAVGVAVGEVAGPVHAVAHPLGRGLGVVVVAGELAGARGVHQLADALAEVDHPPVLVELGSGALLAGLRVEDGDTLEWLAEGTGRGARDPADDHRVLGRAEPVDHQAPESLREGRGVAVAGFVPEDEPQGVLGVVGTLGRGQDVRERLADVGGIGRAEVPHVGQELRRRELLPKRHRSTGDECRRPARHHRVGVEQRHRDVVHVLGGEAEPLGEVLPGVGDLLVRDPHRLGPAARARGEDQHEEGVIGAHVPPTARHPRRECRGPLSVGSVDHLDAVQVESVEQVALGRISEEELDVGATEVGHQGVAAASAVHSDRDVSAQPGGGQAEEHLWRVVHQEPNVRWPVRVEQVLDRCRPSRRVGNQVAP